MDSIKMSIPIPLQIVIDDVGWWSGKDGHLYQEPFRTGIERDHTIEDYEAIIYLGRKLNMRPQAAIVLCEWDRENILRDLPSSTWMGKKWDNSRWTGPWLDEAASIIRSNPKNIELALHGIGHEYWVDGTFSRAEWYDRQGNMRPREEIAGHIKYYEKLMEQNGLGDFPESFVPAAFHFCFHDGENGLNHILKEKGIKYISTPFSEMKRLVPPQEKLFGVEFGTMIVDRGDEILITKGNDTVSMRWNFMDCYPSGEIPGPICGLHWPNILHPDPKRNIEVVDRYVKIFNAYEHRFDRILAENTSVCWTQLAYSICTKKTIVNNLISLDFTSLNELALQNLLPWFRIKIESEKNIKISSNNAKVDYVSRNGKAGHQIFKIHPDKANDIVHLRVKE